MRELGLREAKAALSTVVDAAEQGETTIITRHGKPTAVVVGLEQWERMRNVPSFARLLMAFPLEPDAEPLFERDPSPPRDDDL